MFFVIVYVVNSQKTPNLRSKLIENDKNQKDFRNNLKYYKNNAIGLNDNPNASILISLGRYTI